MKAIVYHSGTGHTARYAEALSKLSGLPAYPVEKALKELAADTRIFYMTWVKAGSLVKIGKISEQFLICGIGAVALNTGAGQDLDLRIRTGLAPDFPLFMLPGGYDPAKVPWLDRKLMELLLWKLNRDIRNKIRPTERDLAMQEVLTNGGDYYEAQVLEPIQEWIQEQQKL